MAKTISSLLVGIGLDFDEKSTRGVDSSFDRVKSSALKLGAVVAGAFGINQLTSGFAQSNDALGKFSETYGLIANDVAAFDRALQKSGGQAGSFISQMEGLERLRAATRVGDYGFLDAASKAGINTGAIIDASDATEAYLALADQFNSASLQQRLNMADALGLDDASIRLLSTGRKEVSALVATEKRRRPVTRGMLDMSRDFNDEWQDMNTNIGRVADTVSVKLLPHVNSLLAGFNGWSEANQKLIDSGVDKFIGDVAENIELISVGAAALAAPVLLKGLGAVAGVLATIAKRTAPGAAGVAGYLAGGKIHDQLPIEASNLIGRGITTVRSALGHDLSAQALNAEDMAREIAIKDRRRSTRSTNDMPEIVVNVKHQTILDGKVIETTVRRIEDAGFVTMAEELGSNAR